MTPLHAKRIEDLGPGDVVRVESGARAPPQMPVLDLEPRLQLQGVRRAGNDGDVD